MLSIFQYLPFRTLIAQDGIFIPRELLPVGGKWEMTRRGLEIILRPQQPDRETLAKMMDERRERLRQEFGIFEDSSKLVREARDSR